MTTVLLAAGVLGPFVMVAATLMLGAIRPHYSPIRTFVSQLCLDEGGPWKFSNFLESGRCQTVAFVVSGLLIVIFGLGLRMAGSPEIPAIGWVLIVGAGIGFAGIGVIHDDPWLSYPPGEAPPWIRPPVTFHGRLHVAASFITGVFLLLGFIAFAGRWDGRWLVYSLATFFLFLASYGVAVVSGWHSGTREPPGGKAGLFQRLSIFEALIWIAALAWRLL